MDLKEISKNLRKGNLSPFLRKIYKLAYRPISTKGVKVTEEEWDYLIVLDACRYDYFSELNWIEGELESKRSRGSTTAEWLRENFSGQHQDIVYISANPHLSDTEHTSLKPNQLHDTFQPYMKDECIEFGATKAECVTETAKKAARKYPDKRLVIHYIQPHAPYIGEKRIGKGSLYELYSKVTSKEKIQEAYKSNLKYVLESVEDLVNTISGQIIVTADHGEMLGEKGVYAHAEGLYFKELVKVPWLKISKEETSLDSEIDI